VNNIFGKSALCAAGFMAAILGAGTQAQATTVTFGTDSTNGLHDIGTTYSEQGYTFTSTTGDLAFWGDGRAEDPDPTTSVALINKHSVDTVTLTRDGGGTFDLASMHFRGYLGATVNGDGAVNLNWVFGDNTTGSGSVNVTHTAWTTDLLSLKNLKSFSWTPAGDPLNPSHEQVFSVYVDNVVVSATPVPPALPLFMSALAALGFLKRRRTA
jgi:hypothetical protein